MINKTLGGINMNRVKLGELKLQLVRKVIELGE